MKWSWFVHLGHLQLQLVENYVHTTEDNCTDIDTLFIDWK